MLFRELVKDAKSLTDKLLELVSDYDIYCELIGFEIELHKTIHSPIRSGDERPSFILFIPTKLERPLRPEEIWFKDYLGIHGDVFKFAQEFASFNFGLELETRKDIIAFIDNQLKLGLLTDNPRSYKKRKIDYEAAKETKDIFYTSRPFTRRDVWWWLQFGIDTLLLEQYNIKSIQYLLDDTFKVKRTIKTTELAFAYNIYDKLKLYRPEASPEFKWRNSCPAEYLQGIQQLEYLDILIMTKSMKDLLVFKSFMRVDVLAVQGEGMKFKNGIPHYTKKFVVTDYDNAGIKAANQFKEIGFEPRWVSTHQYSQNGKIKVVDKDISDYFKAHGLEKGFQHLREDMFPDLDDHYFKFERVNELINIRKELYGV